LFADPKFPRKINKRSLDILLANGYIPGDECILKGVNKLAPAHAMIFDLNTADLKIWRYWNLPEFDSSVKTNELDLLDELEYLLNDSVKKQLVADVPVGVLLSGGVDSSIVTALASRNVTNLKTFTVSFPGHNNFDESSHANLIANHFGTEHTVLPASDVSVNELFLLAKQFDEPIFDSSMIPTYLVSQLIRKHCKVALGGDGGDELFGGYGHHSRLLWMAENLGKLPVSIRKLAAITARNILPIGFKGRVWFQSLGEDFKNGLPLIASQFEPTTRRKLLSNFPEWELIAENARKLRIPSEMNLLQRATRMDFLNYLPEDILVKVDRSSMLNSLEVRAPLLDYRIIEFAYKKVPQNLKANTIDKKIILKKLTNKLLPPDFDKNRKQGFGIPIGAWIRSNNEWKSFFKEQLLDSNDSIFDKNELNKLLNGHIAGRENTERLFGLLMFELWRKEYNITF
jgi:asparagine synthase (glutamine-hydrolysing)